MAWETSPGRFAALWLLESFVADIGPVNRALTYAIGADKGCWDAPHVLRIPGTKNFKYDGAPRGRLLWSSGTKYSLDDFPAPSPEKRRKKRSTTPRGGGAVKISSKRLKVIRSRLSGEIRLYLDGRGRAIDRSKVMWRLMKELFAAGASEDETFELLSRCAWNKFSDDSLMQQIEKAGGQHAYPLGRGRRHRGRPRPLSA
jgi:hypothetical protein